MPKVWIVNQRNHVYKDADRYGESIVITEEIINVFAVDNLVKNITEKMIDYSSEDYILLSGYAILNCIAIHHILKRYGVAHLLIWEANNHKYKAVTLNDF